MRAAMILVVGSVCLATGLQTARIQSSNQALAGELDRLTRDCAWLERAALQHRQRIATARFEAELWVEDPSREVPGRAADTGLAMADAGKERVDV